MKIEYRNGEGYRDPTAFEALKNISKEGKNNGNKRSKHKKRKVLEK